MVGVVGGGGGGHECLGWMLPSLAAQNERALVAKKVISFKTKAQRKS